MTLSGYHAFQTIVPHNLWLAAKSSTRGGRETARPDATRPEKKLLNVLIIEDELFVAWHLEDLVRGLAFRVSEISARGEDAVLAAKKHAPDLILMDVNLGAGIDGVEAASRILKTAQVPIVFVTAYSDARTLERIRSVVPDAPIVQKPVTTEALKKAIGSVLRPPAN